MVTLEASSSESNMRLWMVVTVLGMSACAESFDPDAQPVGDVSFARQVAPIFAVRCVHCHHPDDATGIDLTQPFDPERGIINRANTWTDASSTLLVEPGNVGNSFLIDKVSRTDLDPSTEGGFMPWNIDPLTSDEIAVVRQWITDGANNDAFFADNVAPIFGDGVSLGRRGGKCAYCHYPDGPNPPDLTQPFDAEVGVVNVESAFSGVLVVPGEPDQSFLVTKIENTELETGLGEPMPLHYPALSKRQVDILKAWIEQGAKNN